MDTDLKAVFACFTDKSLLKCLVANDNVNNVRVKTSNFGRFFAVSLLQHGLCFAPDMSPG